MKTMKLYDIDAYQTSFEAQVLECVEIKDTDAKHSGMYRIVPDRTLFFPEEGGQTPDRGYLQGISVLDVQIQGDVIYHYLPKALEVGTTVCGEIDWQHRFSNMQQHSGEHIFSGLAYGKFGYQNVGFHLSDQIVTMDFDHPFTEEQLQEMELEVNRAIVANAPVETGYPTPEELQKMVYRSKLDFTEGVRIVEIKGYDVCACCAPHVHQTGEIGMFKIQSAQNYKGGMRISFLCGFRALEEYKIKSAVLNELTGIMTTNQAQLAENVIKLKNQVQSLGSQLVSANQKIMEYKIAELPQSQTDVVLFEAHLDTPVMRSVVNRLMETHPGVCGVFVGSDESGYNYILGSKSVDCRELANRMKAELSARGGGGAQMIQGSVVASKNTVEEFLHSVSKL